MTQNLGIIDDLSAVSQLLEWRGKQVLDVGCGPGRLSRGLASLGATVRGFEPDPVQAQKNLEVEPTEGVVFAQAAAEDLPVDANSVDVVVLSRSLHHVPVDAMDKALAEAHRVLRKDGVLLVMEPDIHGQFSQLIKPFHDETEVRALAIEAQDRAASLFSTVEELWFTTQMRFDDIESFKAMMIGMSFNDIVAERIEQPEVDAAFAAGRDEEGYRFTNPVRVRVFRL